MATESTADTGVWSRLTAVLVRYELVSVLLLTALAGWGIAVAPFGWDTGLDVDGVAVDALPDLGENQQVVFTEWGGQSPRDIEDQITYPLTSVLLGVPGVRTVRSQSMTGFSSIYVVFDDDVDFYWARSRVIEKLASLPTDLLPAGVQPRLGPDATALGQVLWYTLEGRDESGSPTGGWDLHELREIQDETVRYALMAVDGVSEVAGVGGYDRELVVEMDPVRLDSYGLTVSDVYRAVSESSDEIGAGVTEVNGVEYLIRGIGFAESEEDVANAVIDVVEGAPVLVSDVARVSSAPAMRRGALDRGGVEVVGGVVIARYGANPMEVLERLHEAIERLAPSLPSRELADGRTSRVTLVPFYDRSELIADTLGTLERALVQQVLVTLLVVLIMLGSIRGGALVSIQLPMAVLLSFGAMKAFGVDANVVALAGIAIAIGSVVDLGIVVIDNVVERLRECGTEDDPAVVARRAVAEVTPAVLTAVATTVLSFLPIFLLEGSEGRLFRPLAFTKTFALLGGTVAAIALLPVLANRVLATRIRHRALRDVAHALLVMGGVVLALRFNLWAGVACVLLGGGRLVDDRMWPTERGGRVSRWVDRALLVLAAAALLLLLRDVWMPLGADVSAGANLRFAAMVTVGLLIVFRVFQWLYPALLRWVLENRWLFLPLPVCVVLGGLSVWLGAEVVLDRLPESWRTSPTAERLMEVFPGLDREFMPSLDEGAFLYMPTMMPHGSMGEALDVIADLDRRIETVPEVTSAVGKIGRAETALDPAPVSMVETIIAYESEYIEAEDGRRLRFAFDEESDAFVRDEAGELVEDPDGRPYRNWRPEIRSADDIWDAIVEAAQLPGVTSAPLLQPISARVVMLQSGIRAPMAVRLFGDDLDDLAEASLAIEALLRTIPEVRSDSVNADRPVGKPYLEIRPRRDDLARYGLTMAEFQRFLRTGVAGAEATVSYDGRVRHAVTLRFPRELRDTPARIEALPIPRADGHQIRVSDVADVVYVRGPQMIRGEEAHLVTYVMFDHAPGVGETDAVEVTMDRLRGALDSGELRLPSGVTYDFAGSWENAERASKRLRILVPLVLLCVLLLLYVQFRSIAVSLMVFSGVAVALGGGMLMLWLWAEPSFLSGEMEGRALSSVFGVGEVNLSVAVWVGFIALFGIATDDGVVMATFLQQRFADLTPTSIDEVHDGVIEAGKRRIRACLMTTATTLIALLPVLGSTGTGADVMIPVAIPIVGGMAVELLTLFVVPVLYAAMERMKLCGRQLDSNAGARGADSQGAPTREATPPTNESSADSTGAEPEPTDDPSPADSRSNDSTLTTDNPSTSPSLTDGNEHEPD